MIGAHTPEEETLAAAVITVVADEEGVAPNELEPPLFETINLDALNDLFPPGSNGCVRFTYRDYDIAVSASGDVTIEDS